MIDEVALTLRSFVQKSCEKSRKLSFLERFVLEVAQIHRALIL